MSKRGTIEERFWRHVKKTDSCWIWTAARSKKGYGLIRINRRSKRAHRVVLELMGRGVPSPEQLVMHSCDNPPCVNPDHLIIGTARMNTDDMMSKGRHRPAPPPKGIYPKQFGSALGSRNGNSILTENMVVEIRSRYSAGGIKQKELARTFGVSEACIQALIARRIWSHVQ